ncbi:MAG: GrpB family protein [Verrucomicrobiota bacterium]
MGEETQDEKIARVLKDRVALVPWNPAWPVRFEEEKKHLMEVAAPGLIVRIEHFGSTAVPGLTAKPVIDMLIEVTCLEKTRASLVPTLETEGYDYFWRPSHGEDAPPFYCWFIKRDATGQRSHHLHVMEGHFQQWERLLFRDYLIKFPRTSADYLTLKQDLSARFPGDRIAYTQGKTEFVTRITALAKEDFKARESSK